MLTLFPTVSIIWAAFRVSSLACSISILGENKLKNKSFIKMLPRKSNILLDSSLGDERLAKGNSVIHSLNHQLKGSLRISNHSHAMMDPSRSQSSLGYFKSSSFSKQNVCYRNSHILENHFSMTSRRVLCTKNTQRSQYLKPSRYKFQQPKQIILPVTPGVSKGTNTMDCC